MNWLRRIIANLGVVVQRVWYSDEGYARAVGVRIGKDCLVETRNWGTEPYLIEIGNHVRITMGVSFVNHDGGIWVFREDMPDLDVFGKIKIGNNTYIGNNATILPGVTIGSHCVIGASSVVTKSIPDNTVAAGCPIRFISSTEEYKRKMMLLDMGTKGMSPNDKKRSLMGIPPDKEIKRAWLKEDREGRS